MVPGMTQMTKTLTLTNVHACKFGMAHLARLLIQVILTLADFELI